MVGGGTKAFRAELRRDRLSLPAQDGRRGVAGVEQRDPPDDD